MRPEKMDLEQNALLKNEETFQIIKERLKKIEDERYQERYQGRYVAEVDADYETRALLFNTIGQLEPQKAIAAFSTILHGIQRQQKDLGSQIFYLNSNAVSQHDLYLILQAISEIYEILVKNNINIPEMPTSVGDLTFDNVQGREESEV